MRLASVLGGGSGPVGGGNERVCMAACASLHAEGWQDWVAACWLAVMPQQGGRSVAAMMPKKIKRAAEAAPRARAGGQDLRPGQPVRDGGQDGAGEQRGHGRDRHAGRAVGGAGDRGRGRAACACGRRPALAGRARARQPGARPLHGGGRARRGAAALSEQRGRGCERVCTGWCWICCSPPCTPHRIIRAAVAAATLHRDTRLQVAAAAALPARMLAWGRVVPTPCARASGGAAAEQSAACLHRV